MRFRKRESTSKFMKKKKKNLDKVSTTTTTGLNTYDVNISYANEFETGTIFRKSFFLIFKSNYKLYWIL